ncbi:MAG: hypothetical protein KatS3mg013_0306 [Actinomycetota bacterium]|jgi:hypothetical protein|nr:MAG: hypothetical protein KatS3mg013_0306 [Actinomycetota bacterium]
MVRFQRQPPGTALTRSLLLIGGAAAVVAGAAVIAGRGRAGGAAALASGAMLLLGTHRANHGAGGPVDRMLGELLDRAWDAAVLGPIAWVTRSAAPSIAAAALVALSGSFLSSYIRARGAALQYSVEESHVTRGLRYGLVGAGLVADRPAATVWATAILVVLAAVVRTAQVAREERAT